MNIVMLVLVFVAIIVVISIVSKLFWLLIFAALALFIVAPKWFGKTSSKIVTKTRNTVRKNMNEFKKGLDEDS